MARTIEARKSDRPTVADVAAAAGVSVATVDRVINGRLPVRAKTAQRVKTAAEEVGFHAKILISHRLADERPQMRFGFMLQRHSEQFYRAFGNALEHATRSSDSFSGDPLVEYLDDLRPAHVAERLRELAAKVDAVGLVAADHPYINKAISELRENGKAVVALLSDLSAPARAGYVGMDWRKMGRTAGWAMARLAHGSGRVVIIVGSHRYLATEVCEISFQTYLRENATHLQLLEPLVNFEEPRLAYQATLDMLQKAKDLVGIYMVGGGVEGVMEALRESGAAKRVTTVCHDLTDDTRLGLVDGVLDLVMHQPRPLMASAAVSTMFSAARVLRSKAATNADGPSESAASNHVPQSTVIPFELYSAENI